MVFTCVADSSHIFPPPSPKLSKGAHDSHTHTELGFLKVQCHDIFNTFYIKKKLYLGPNEQAKAVSQTLFVFREDIGKM